MIFSETRVPVGKMEVNMIGSLEKISGGGSGGVPLAELDVDSDSEDGKGNVMYTSKHNIISTLIGEWDRLI